MAHPIDFKRVSPTLLGLLMAFAFSCSAPPLRPLSEESLDAKPGEKEDQDDPDDPEGEPRDDNSEGDSEVPAGSEPDSETKDPVEAKDPPIKDGDDPVVTPDPKPVVKEPKYSLLFIGGGTDQIAVYKFDKKTGAASLLKNHATNGAYATFLAVHPESRSVFAVDERGNQVLMLSVDPASGVLTDADKKPTASGPTHISVDPTGKAVFVATYGAGSVQSYSVNGKQLLAKSTKNPGRNAHAAHIASGKVFVPCLGSGLIAQFSYSADGTLTEATPASLDVGTKGPRHMAFHPAGKHAFLMNEYEGSIQALSFDGSRLTLNGGQVASTSAPVAGNTGAEIQVHPNGKFLYSSNRGDDSIAIYTIADNGTVALQKTVKTGGRTPRHFALDPSGSWLTVANQGSNLVTIFEVDKASGGLSPKSATLEFKSAQYAEIFDFYE